MRMPIQKIDRKLKRDNWEAVLLFFIHPFMAFILAISNLQKKSSFLVLLLFFTLFGYTFIAQSPTIDSFRYVEEFNSYKYITTPHFLNDLRDYFTLNSNLKDIYAASSYYLISRISSNYHILMCLWAFIFSIFFLKAFRFFVDRPEFKRSLPVFLLTFLFIYSNNIFNINGVRFYTASWIMVYTIFEIVIYKNYKYLILAFITPLIHIAFLSVIGVFMLYLITCRYEIFWVFIFIISFFISQISLELVQSYQGYAPKIIQNLIWSYSAVSNVQDRLSDIEILPLYAQIFNALPRYFINLLMFIFVFKRKLVNSLPEMQSIYILLLVLLSFSNLTMSIPSFGARIITIVVPVMLYLCLISYSKISLLNKLLYLIPLVYSYSLLYWVRYMILVTDPMLLISIFPQIITKYLY